MYTQMPTSFTVSAEIFNAETGEEMPEGSEVTLTRDEGEHLAHRQAWRFSFDGMVGGPWSIDLHEVEDMYKAHMIAQLREITVEVVADDIFFAHKGIFALHFGAYGCTHVIAFGCLEDALERAASVLPPGFFSEPDMEVARQEMYDNGDLSEEEYNDRDSDEVSDKIHEYATTDLTYTESGYLTSYEWTCTEFSSLQEALEWAQSVSK